VGEEAFIDGSQQRPQDGKRRSPVRGWQALTPVCLLFPSTDAAFPSQPTPVSPWKGEIMPQLTTFQSFAYEQGPELQKTYAFNKEIQAGICFSLMVDWIKDLMNKPAHTIAERKKVLEDAFTLAAGRQRIYSSGFSSASKGTGMLTYDKITELMTELGRLYGLKFTYKELGTAVDPFSTALLKSDYQDKYLYLEISGSWGAHAIGLYAATTILVFDPNLGEFSLSRSGTTVRDFSQALWAKYASWNFTITRWVLFQAEKKETVFKMWQDKAKA
jgi:hypothetical protein